jgi:hypothetical protein
MKGFIVGILGALLLTTVVVFITLGALRYWGVYDQIITTTIPNSSQRAELCADTDLRIFEIYNDSSSCCNSNGAVIWYTRHSWPWTDGRVEAQVVRELESVGLTVYKGN